MVRPAIFLDRDGVLNVGVHGDYVRQVDQFRWLPGAAAAVASLSKAGWPVVVVTNQSGIGRGFFTMGDVDRVHAKMREDVAAEGGEIAGVYVCPHHPDDQCSCRKPLPGMLISAASDLDLDLPRSIFIGDTEGDMRAGRAAGCRVMAVRSGLTTPEAISRWSPAPDRVFDTLVEAAEWINAHGTDFC